MRILNPRFLLADDDSDDAELFREALGEVARDIECNAVENGKKLFEWLANCKANLPDVIFLDINMPVMNGWECLRTLKQDPAYRSIPVIIYSTSSARKDIEMAYSLGALLFITKPEDFRELSQILEVVATSSEESIVDRLRGFPTVKVA